jgi:hypothetical protein
MSNIVLILFLVFPVLIAASSASISGELLYWTAHENGLGYAIKSEGNPTFVEDGKVKDIDFQYNLGAQVEVAISLHRNFDLLLRGTHFHTYTHTEATAEEDGFLFPIWINAAASSSGFIEKAHARWRLHFGMGDLDCARKVHIGKRLLLTPYLGLRGVVARQKYEITYSGGTLFPDGEDIVHMKNKFAGIGPLAGVKVDWTFWKFLSLYADFDVALPFGHFYLHESEYATIGNERRLRLFHEFNHVRAMLDAAIGIEATYRWLSFYVGWDEHLLFGQNQFIRLIDHETPAASVSNQGDLSLNGLCFGISAAF